MKIFLLLLVSILIFGCSNSNNNKIIASGTIETTEIDVVAKVGGEIIKIFTSEGSTVRKGDTLALIEHTDLIIQLKQAKANADAAEAQYRLAIKGSREEDIVQAQANYKNAEEDLKRMTELYKTNTISQKQFEDAQTRYVIAKEAFEKLKRGFRSEEIEIAHARKLQALAQVEAIQKKINDSYVTSPANGIVTIKTFEEGETVMPNSVLFRISHLDKVFLMVYLTELQLPHIKLGQTAKITIDAQPDAPFTGTIVFISPTAEFTPKNIQTTEDRTKLVFGVKIEIPNTEHKLKPGLPADAVIEINSHN